MKIPCCFGPAMVVLLFAGSACNRPITTTPLSPSTWTSTPTGTVSPAFTGTVSFTSTWTRTATPDATSTPTWTSTASPTSTPFGVATATFTPTWTPSPTRTDTFTPVPGGPTATPTATGCAKFCVDRTTDPVGQTVAAGTTILGLRMNFGQCPIGAYCGKVLTGIQYQFTTLTGNLATEILETQLWYFDDMRLLASAPGLVTSLNGFEAGGSPVVYLKYVLSPAASGVIRTKLTTFSGYEGAYPPGTKPIIPLALNGYPESGPQTVVAP